MNKKAFEQSIGAIVTVILALASLIVIVSFSERIFGKTTGSFEEQISREPEPPLAHSSIPITLSRETIMTYPATSNVIKVMVFNPTNHGWKFDQECDDCVQLNIGCAGGLDLESVTNPKEIKPGSSTTFSALLKVGKEAAKGSYLCTLSIEEYQKDLTIEIN